MHWIARHILKRLTFADALSYTDLKPQDVEGNLFQYHARRLIADGLVERSEAGYQLTEAGRRFVADLSATRVMQPRRQPQPMVAAACRRGDEWLLFNWNRHPYRGRTSLVMGRHVLGYDTVAAAADQLCYKAGLTGAGTYLGQLEIIIRTATEIVSHSLVSVVSFAVDGEPSSDELTGTSYWLTLEQARQGGESFISGFEEMLAWCEDSARDPYSLIECTI